MDREKVIHSLERCLAEGRRPWIQDLRDALALLKAQEAIRPNEIRHGDVLMYYQCPACMSALRSVDRYCSQCGRAVKWE